MTERHVADMLGRSVYVGDEVCAMVSYASGSSTRRSALVLGQVTEILPAHVRVLCQVPYGDTRPGRHGYLGDPTTMRVRDSDMVKVTERRP